MWQFAGDDIFTFEGEQGPSELPELIVLATNLFRTPKDLENIVSYSAQGTAVN